MCILQLESRWQMSLWSVDPSVQAKLTTKGETLVDGFSLQISAPSALGGQPLVYDTGNLNQTNPTWICSDIKGNHPVFCNSRAPIILTTSDVGT